MKLGSIKESGEYIISGYGNISASEIEELNSVGILIGEVVFVNKEIKCNKNICFIKLEVDNIAISKKLFDEIEVM